MYMVSVFKFFNAVPYGYKWSEVSIVVSLSSDLRKGLWPERNDPDVREKLPKRFLEPFAWSLFLVVYALVQWVLHWSDIYWSYCLHAIEGRRERKRVLLGIMSSEEAADGGVVVSKKQRSWSCGLLAQTAASVWFAYSVDVTYWTLIRDLYYSGFSYYFFCSIISFSLAMHL